MHGNLFRRKIPKIAKSKISNPKKILRSSPSVEIGSTLWAKAAKYLKKYKMVKESTFLKENFCIIKVS